MCRAESDELADGARLARAATDGRGECFVEAPTTGQDYEQGIATLVVYRDVFAAPMSADKALPMDDSEVSSTGPPQRMLAEENLRPKNVIRGRKRNGPSEDNRDGLPELRPESLKAGMQAVTPGANPGRRFSKDTLTGAVALSIKAVSDSSAPPPSVMIYR
jgi:hypothetical protein